MGGSKKAAVSGGLESFVMQTLVEGHCQVEKAGLPQFSGIVACAFGNAVQLVLHGVFVQIQLLRGLADGAVAGVQSLEQLHFLPELFLRNIPEQPPQEFPLRLLRDLIGDDLQQNIVVEYQPISAARGAQCTPCSGTGLLELAAGNGAAVDAGNQAVAAFLLYGLLDLLDQGADLTVRPLGQQNYIAAAGASTEVPGILPQNAADAVVHPGCLVLVHDGARGTFQQG